MRKHYPSEAPFLTNLLGSRGARKVGTLNCGSTNPQAKVSTGKVAKGDRKAQAKSQQV